LSREWLVPKSRIFIPEFTVLLLPIFCAVHAAALWMPVWHSRVRIFCRQPPSFPSLALVSGAVRRFFRLEGMFIFPPGFSWLQPPLSRLLMGVPAPSSVLQEVCFPPDFLFFLIANPCFFSVSFTPTLHRILSLSVASRRRHARSCRVILSLLGPSPPAVYLR